MYTVEPEFCDHPCCLHAGPQEKFWAPIAVINGPHSSDKAINGPYSSDKAIKGSHNSDKAIKDPHNSDKAIKDPPRVKLKIFTPRPKMS